MTLNQDQIKNISFTCKAIAVTPSNTVDLTTPGLIFIDQTGTEGNVKVDLINGGTLVLAMTKDMPLALCPVVKRVYASGTTASGIFVNPIAQ